MNLIDGQATCFFCGDRFDTFQYYEVHVAMCRDIKRTYVPMKAIDKKRVIEKAEALMREMLPGTLLGYGETL